MINVGIAQALSIIDQQHCRIVKIILRQFIMMTIAIVHEKVKNCRIDQVQKSA